MLYLEDPGLDAATARGLRAYQTKVDSSGTYAERANAGKTLFDRYNRKKNRVFKVVRERLVAHVSLTRGNERNLRQVDMGTS